MSNIRVVNFFELVVEGRSDPLRYQNYFFNTTATYQSKSFEFVPFRAEGALAALNGDNEVLQVLFPNVEAEPGISSRLGVILLEMYNGNRLTELTLSTAWLDASGTIIRAVDDYYIGIGASVSETTIELRFRSAIDSVGSAFPARTLTRQLVGPLPLNSELYLT
jgi:hypothetical protein